MAALEAFNGLVNTGSHQDVMCNQTLADSYVPEGSQDECADSMFPSNSDTCWADEAYQRCAANRQGAYDVIMAAGGSNMAALDAFNNLVNEGSYQNVTCNEPTDETESPAQDETVDAGSYTYRWQDGPTVTDRVVVEGGSFLNEKLWEIECNLDVIVNYTEGIAPFNQDVTLPACAVCVLRMNDTF